MALHVNKFSKSLGNNCTLDYNDSRIQGNIEQAHIRLNTLVVKDSTPYVPFSQGQLRSQVRYPNGIRGNRIEWYADYAHYQYYGTLYTDQLGRTFVGAGETKPVNTGIPLNYHEPMTTSKWVETAKENHLEQWVRDVKRIAGGK